MNVVAARRLLTHHTDDWGHAWWPLWLLSWATVIGSERASFISGAMIPIDCGKLARGA